MLLKVLDRSDEVDDCNRVYQYKYQGFLTIITFSNAKTGAFGDVAKYNGLPETQAYSRLMFDPSYPDTGHGNVQDCDWIFFEGTVEAITPSAQPSRGKEVDAHMFMDSNNAGNKWARGCRISFMMYMNT